MAIEVLTDWQQERSAIESAGIPMVLVVEQSDCPYCVELRQEVILPMLKGSATKTALFRSIMMDTGETLTDQNGDQVKAREFVRRYGVDFSPTVLFLDQGASELADPLVGYQGGEFYAFYLEKAIKAATANFRRNNP